MKSYLNLVFVQTRKQHKNVLALVLGAFILLVLSLVIIAGNTQILFAAQNSGAGYGGGETGYQGGVTSGQGQGSGGASTVSNESPAPESPSASTPTSDATREGRGGEGSGSGGKPEGQTPGSGGSGQGGEGEEPIVGNNLSFPVIATDGFGISEILSMSFLEVYEGPYTGLSEEQRMKLEGFDWFAQKTEGNTWQAEYKINPIGTDLTIFGVDWGDNVEAVNPVIGRPFRVEVTLYVQPEETMEAYTMELLAFPSSPNEVQGTNGETYENEYATVVTPGAEFRIQYLGETIPANMTWNGDQWTKGGQAIPVTDLNFGPELNVGGKYIFGASKGGWRPVEPGIYRLTFFVPDSDILFTEAVVGNYADWTAIVDPEATEEEEETGAADPVIDTANNLTYVDVTVVTKHEGRKPENPGEGEDTEGDMEISALTTDVQTTGSVGKCEPYLTDYLGIGLENDPIQVVLLQDFLNDTLGTNILLTGIFDDTTEAAVRLFQTTYAEDILEPWIVAGHDDVSLYLGTGFVGATTLEKINEIMCSRR